MLHKSQYESAVVTMRILCALGALCVNNFSPSSAAKKVGCEVSKHERFMRIAASARAIMYKLELERLTRGIDWRKSKKSDMAKAYENGETFGRAHPGPVIDDDVVTLLESYFGCYTK